MQLYNTLTRKKEEFVPAHPGKASMYVCGITAYDYCHIGHARSAVVFDVLARYIRSMGLKLTFVRNFTDVDDKIINRANKEGLDSRAIAEKYIAAFHEDMDRLKVFRADIEPKATEHIDDMLAMCEQLIRQGNAYATPSGDVYFRVESDPNYGELSGRTLDEMEAGARVTPGEEKENPLDFALWKAAKPGEPFWASPWGNGRPGWHIECSAMSEKYLELPLDIHGGGQDLIFPHHENEIAQSECAMHQKMCNYWVHNGFVQINSEKMSKSLGNFKTIRDILEVYQPETLRFFLLTRQYRSPIDFSFDAMDDSERNLKRIYLCISAIKQALTREKWSEGQDVAPLLTELESIAADWEQAMADDINTAAAFGHVNNAIHLVNRVLDDKKLVKTSAAKQLFERFLTLLHSWSEILGVFDENPDAYLRELRNRKVTRQGIDTTAIESLMQERLTARQAKNFVRADELRTHLQELGVIVNDTPDGAVWDIN